MEDRQLRLLTILAVILLALGTVYYVWEPSDGEEADEVASEDATEPVWEVEIDAVRRIAVTAPAGEMVLEAEGDGWRMKKPIDYPADTEQVLSLLRELSRSQLGVPIPELEPADAGLGDGEARGRFKLTDEVGLESIWTLRISTQHLWNPIAALFCQCTPAGRSTSHTLPRMYVRPYVHECPLADREKSRPRST